MGNTRIGRYIPVCQQTGMRTAHYLAISPNWAVSALLPLEIGRYPDEEAGQIPMAFVVRQPGSMLSDEEVMDFVGKQNCAKLTEVRGIANSKDSVLMQGLVYRRWSARGHPKVIQLAEAKLRSEDFSTRQEDAK
ncbi:hypothetical protein BHM03_00039230, partial [Ensete ventricosum]